jgi:hypothetical protein
MPTPLRNAVRPSGPAAIERGTLRPKSTSACVRSKPPAIRPPASAGSSRRIRRAFWTVSAAASWSGRRGTCLSPGPRPSHLERHTRVARDVQRHAAAARARRTRAGRGGQRGGGPRRRRGLRPRTGRQEQRDEYVPVRTASHYHHMSCATPSWSAFSQKHGPVRLSRR